MLGLEFLRSKEHTLHCETFGDQLRSALTPKLGSSRVMYLGSSYMVLNLELKVTKAVLNKIDTFQSRCLSRLLRIFGRTTEKELKEKEFLVNMYVEHVKN